MSDENKEAVQTSGDLWLRKCRVLITDAQDNEAANVSDLRVTFRVQRKRDTQNFATVSIYNLTADKEKEIIEKGDRVIIEAGYMGVLTTETKDEKVEVKEAEPQQYGVIFDGKILYPARGREGNVDFVLTLICVDGTNALDLAWVSFTQEKGMTQRQIVENVCVKSNITINESKVSNDLNPTRLPRGKVFFGTPRAYFNDVCRGNAATFFMDGDKLELIKWTDPVQDEALVVEPRTGLIGVPTQTQDGASFELLLNPHVRLGMLIKLKNSEITENTTMPEKGKHRTPLDPDLIYQVIELTHTGDTRGNEWYTQINGISRYGKGVLAALMTSAVQNPNGK